VPIGIPEVVREGSDLTLVSYGSTFNLCAEGRRPLGGHWASAWSSSMRAPSSPSTAATCIVESLKKTNRLLVVDEDVPGGASAYILQQILEVQGGYRYLDAAPLTLTAKAHRPAYGSDGDYFSKPSVEDVVEKVVGMVKE
jgi:pyruvate/2-oxoglutarate/acetoin dehydrogenase E1 component